MTVVKTPGRLDAVGDSLVMVGAAAGAFRGLEIGAGLMGAAGLATGWMPPSVGLFVIGLDEINPVGLSVGDRAIGMGVPFLRGGEIGLETGAENGPVNGAAVLNMLGGSIAVGPLPVLVGWAD